MDQQHIREDIVVDDEGKVHHNLVVTDPSGIRRVVSAHLDHVPGFQGEYEGNEDKSPDEADDHLPVLILKSISADEDEESKTDIYLVGPSEVNDLITKGIHMFTQDDGKTRAIVAMMNLMMGNEIEIVDNTGKLDLGDDDADQG